MELPVDCLDLALISDKKYDKFFKNGVNIDLYDSMDLATLASWVCVNDRYSAISGYFDSRAASYFKYKNYDFVVPMCPGRVFLGRWYNEKKYYLLRIRYLDLAAIDIPEDPFRVMFPSESTFKPRSVHSVMVTSSSRPIVVKFLNIPYAMCLSPDRTHLVLFPVTIEQDRYKIDVTKKQFSKPLRFLHQLRSCEPKCEPKRTITFNIKITITQ